MVNMYTASIPDELGKRKQLANSPVHKIVASEVAQERQPQLVADVSAHSKQDQTVIEQV